MSYSEQSVRLSADCSNMRHLPGCDRSLLIGDADGQQNYSIKDKLMKTKGVKTLRE